MTIMTLQQKINETPTAEIKYHLLLLLSALNEKKVDKGDFVDEIEQFVIKINLMLKKINEAQSLEESEIEALNKSYQTLLKLSQTNTLGVRVGYALLNVIGVVAAIIFGVIGALVGGVAGFARGIWNLSNPFKSTGIGVIMGVALGGIIGFRAPKKLVKDEYIRRLKYSLDGIGDRIKNTLNQPLASFEASVVENYFGGNRESFEKFKNLPQVDFSIDTLKATFISPTLEGYLGHHALIKIENPLIKIKPIKQESENVAIVEFSTGKADITREISQHDQRTVTGAKVIEMLLFHEQLQLTHAPTTKYLAAKMKQGEVDCLSYANKILSCTGQAAAKVRRFNGTENAVGKHVIGFFIQKLHPFAQDALTKLTPSTSL